MKASDVRYTERPVRPYRDKYEVDISSSDHADPGGGPVLLRKVDSVASGTTTVRQITVGKL